MLLFGRTEVEMGENPYGLRINKQSGFLVQPDALTPFDQYNRQWRANYHNVKMPDDKRLEHHLEVKQARHL